MRLHGRHPESEEDVDGLLKEEVRDEGITGGRKRCDKRKKKKRGRGRKSKKEKRSSMKMMKEKNVQEENKTKESKKKHRARNRKRKKKRRTREVARSYGDIYTSYLRCL